MIKYRVKNNAGTRHTLYTVFLGIIKMYAPFLPHITEEIYHRIFSRHEKKLSIHLESWPSPIGKFYLEEGRKVKEIIASLRRYKNESNRKRLGKVTIVVDDAEAISKASDTIKGALSIDEINFVKSASVESRVEKVRPIFNKLGPILRENMNEFLEYISKISPEKLENGIEFNGKYVGPENFNFEKTFLFQGKKVDVLKFEGYAILIE